MPGARPHTARRAAPEKAAQRQVKALLGFLGYHVSDMSQPRASMVTPGVPDLYAMRAPFPGAETDVPNAFWVEVKAPGSGRLSKAQQAWHAEARKAGALVFVATCAADLEPHLRALGAPIA